MTGENEPWRALRRISLHVDKLEPMDRELLGGLAKNANRVFVRRSPPSTAPR